MKPGTWSQGRWFASLIGVFGGGVLLLASRSPGERSHPVVGIDLPAVQTECEKFFANEADVPPDGVGEGYETATRKMVLYRNKKWQNLDLANGAMIGGIENTHSSEPSATYPRLGHKEKGCIFFRHGSTEPGGKGNEAYFYPAKAGNRVKLNSAWYCRHDPVSNPSRKPIWTSMPGGMCETVMLTVSDRSVTISARNLAPASLMKELEDGLVKAGLDSLSAQAAVRQGGNGPWYPCDPNGCCRAT
jgi:hypothetical protein